MVWRLVSERRFFQNDIFLYPVFLLVFLCTVQSVQIRSILPGQQWPGFSFALHLLRVQGFYFSLLQYSHIQAFTAAFISSMQVIPPTLQNVEQGFTVAFPAIVPIQLSQIPDRHKRLKCSLRHTGAYHNAAAPPPIPDTTAAPDAVQVSTAAYYNRVYKGAAYRRPCQPGGVSMLLTPDSWSPSTGLTWH